jgi:hypothetical protein
MPRRRRKPMQAQKMTLAAIVLSGLAIAAGTGQTPEAKPVHGEGCVEAGVEARCLVVRDVASGKLYNLLAKEPRPRVGEGIEFDGVVYQGVSVCMQGVPMKVTSWKEKDSLKCGVGNRN